MTRRTLLLLFLVSALAACSPWEQPVAVIDGVDAGSSRGGASDQLDGCLPGLLETSNALARYDFEDDSDRVYVRDSLGNHDGVVHSATAVQTDGPDGCGRAFSFEQDQRFIVLPDSPAWGIAEGSIEFWLRVPDEPMLDHAGIISRDTFLQETSGQFSIWLTTERRIEVRLQDAGGAEDNGMRCSVDPLPAGRWAHVLFNFGPDGLELWINGAISHRSGEPAMEVQARCDSNIEIGLEDNGLDWIVGASSYLSQDAPSDLSHHFVGGAIDALRISAERRRPTL